MNLNEILDVDIRVPHPSNITTKDVVAINVSNSLNNTIQQDALDARNNVRLLIAQGNQAVAELLALARDLKTPRAYEVASTMLKTMAELSHDLLSVYQQEHALTQEPSHLSERELNIENAVFVGSTSDLGELVKQQRVRQHANTIITVEAETTGIQTETCGAEILPQKSTS